MNIAVTVGAVGGDHKAGTVRICLIRIIQEAADMCTRAAGQAGVAQLRAGLDQQSRMIRAVHVVTQRAVLADRLVLPQKRAAFFGVAGVAVLIDRELMKRRGAGRTMRVMTIAANHLVFPGRVS